MKPVMLSLVFLLSLNCASKKINTSDAKQELEDKYSKQIGTATKSDFMEQFGNAEWCRPQPSGDETCRFYLKRGTRWLGEKRDRKSYEQFDEIVADFDSAGKLKSFTANAQR